MIKYRNFRTIDSRDYHEIFVEEGGFASKPIPAQVVMGADEEIDCGGKIMLPSFIDSHCHILPTGLDLLKLNLTACSTREEIMDSVRDRNRSQPDGWLLAVQYDHNKFADGQHLTVHDLDAISDSRPILLRHYNGHCSVANSTALKRAGVTNETPNPSGGEFVRD
jgi:predicted amidohydrolase YtcJ